MTKDELIERLREAIDYALSCNQMYRDNATEKLMEALALTADDWQPNPPKGDTQ